LPDQAETLARIHLQTDAREKLPHEIRLGKLVDLNHDDFYPLALLFCRVAPIEIAQTPASRVVR
jgi:hypothetical protein